MRKISGLYKILVTVSITLLIVLNLYAQEESVDCRVLLHNIKGSYEGGCKNGFAHGTGIAKGTDSYEGKFKKGLPHGKGKYTWANGNIYDGNWKSGKRNGVGILFSAANGEEVKGQWKNDEFIKEIVDPPYKILYNNSLTRISFVNVKDDLNRIEVVLMRNGVIHRTFDFIDLTGNSGSSSIMAGFMGFENVAYPFEGTLRFKAPNQLNTQVNEYIMRFLITEEGSWKIIANF